MAGGETLLCGLSLSDQVLDVPGESLQASQAP